MEIDEYGPVLQPNEADLRKAQELQQKAQNRDKTALAIQGMMDNQDGVTEKVQAIEKLFCEARGVMSTLNADRMHQWDEWFIKQRTSKLLRWLRLTTMWTPSGDLAELGNRANDCIRVLRSMVLELALAYQKSQNDLKAARIQGEQLKALRGLMQENADMRAFLFETFKGDLQTAELSQMPLRELEKRLLLELAAKRNT
jgi:hypothetical protein